MWDVDMQTFRETDKLVIIIYENINESNSSLYINNSFPLHDPTLNFSFPLPFL